MPVSHHSVFTGWMAFLVPNNSVKALKAVVVVVVAVLGSTPMKKWRIILEQSFTARKSLLVDLAVLFNDVTCTVSMLPTSRRQVVKLI